MALNPDLDSSSSDEVMEDEDDFSDAEGCPTDGIKVEKENAPPKNETKFSARDLFATKSASLRANRKVR